MTETECLRGGKLVSVLLANRARLRAYLCARGANSIADDLLQEMWIKASAIHRDVEPSPLNYLFRMADRMLLDTYRQHARRSERDTNWASVYKSENTALADRQLIAREQVNVVTQRLRELGPRVEYVFWRYRLEGVEQREIAAELGVSLSTVEKDLRKAYGSLVDVKAGFDAV